MFVNFARNHRNFITPALETGLNFVSVKTCYNVFAGRKLIN